MSNQREDKPCPKCNSEEIEEYDILDIVEYREQYEEYKTTWLRCLNCGHTMTEVDWNKEEIGVVI